MDIKGRGGNNYTRQSVIDQEGSDGCTIIGRKTVMSLLVQKNLTAIEIRLYSL